MDDMPSPRYYLMCGLATAANGSQSVVAAGGCNDNIRSLDTVEIFSVEDRKSLRAWGGAQCKLNDSVHNLPI